VRGTSFQDSLCNGIRDTAGKGTLFSKQSGLNYKPKATNLRSFGVCAWKVGGVQYQEIPPIEAEIKNEEVPCSSSKVLLIIDRLQPNK